MNTTSVEPRGDREIVIERTFDAPPHLAFEAWTRPEHVHRPSAEARHAALTSGRETGLRETYEQREALPALLA